MDLKLTGKIPLVMGSGFQSPDPYYCPEFSLAAKADNKNDADRCVTRSNQ
jgi:hypothetical protein